MKTFLWLFKSRIVVVYPIATTGLTPDRVQKYKVDSSKFFTNKDQLSAIGKALKQYDGTSGKVIVDMGKTIGNGILKNGTKLIETTKVQALFNKNGEIITIFPLLK